MCFAYYCIAFSVDIKLSAMVLAQCEKGLLALSLDTE